MLNWKFMFSKLAKSLAFSSPLLTILAIACDEKDTSSKVNYNATIVAPDIEVLGFEGSITIRLNKQLPNELIVRYAKINSEQAPSDDLYTVMSFNNADLKKGDIIWAKVFVQDSYQSTHQVQTNPVRIVVDDVQTSLAISPSIEHYGFMGYNGQGVVVLNEAGKDKLGSNFEARYFVGINEPVQLTDYQVIAPESLRNGMTIYVRIFSKTHPELNIVTNNVLKLKVANLSKRMLPNTLTSEVFSFSGYTANGQVNYNGPILHDALEVRYYKGDKSLASLEPNDFSLALRNLNNGDVVLARLFVKSTRVDDFDVDQSNISLTVNNLIEAISYQIFPNAFRFVGDDHAGTIVLNDEASLLRPEIELRYALSQQDEQPAAIAYQVAPFTNLKNGDQVWVRLFVKDEFLATIELTTNPFKMVVGGLTTKINFRISDSDFEVRGPFATQGTFYLKQSILRGLPNQLEIRYARGIDEDVTNPPSDDAFMTETVYINTRLKNGDVVWAKLFVKPDYEATYELKFNNVQDIRIAKLINSLSKMPINQPISSFDFQFKGGETQAHLEYVGPPLVSQVELRFYRGKNEPSSLNDYKIDIPKNLENNEKIFARLFVRDKFLRNFELDRQFSQNVVTIYVANLTKDLADTLTLFEVELLGQTNYGSVAMRANALLSKHLEMRFAKANGNDAQAVPHDNAFNNTLTNLVDNDKVWVKLFIKNPNSGYKLLDAKPKSFVAIFTLNPEHFAYEKPELPQDFILSSSIVSIPRKAFFYKTLPSYFTLPKNVEIINEEAFKGANLMPTNDSNESKFWAVNDKVVSIDKEAFYKATLPQNFHMPNSLLTIRERAFAQVKPYIANDLLPDSVVRIEPFAFEFTTIMQGFTIPEKVSDIDPIAFDNVILPQGLCWYNKEGSRIYDQSRPYAGCYVDKDF